MSCLFWLMLISLLTCSNFILSEECIPVTITDESATEEGLSLKDGGGNDINFDETLPSPIQPSPSKPALTAEFTDQPESVMKFVITPTNIRKVKLVITTDDGKEVSTVSSREDARIMLFSK